MIASPIPSAICLTIAGIFCAAVVLGGEKERNARIAFAIAATLSFALSFVALVLDYNLFANNSVMAGDLSDNALLVELPLLAFSFFAGIAGLFLIFDS